MTPKNKAQPQPSAELKERARIIAKRFHYAHREDAELELQLYTEIALNELFSIQEEAQKKWDIEKELHASVLDHLAPMHDRAESAEQQLAEARAQVKSFCEMYDECHKVLTGAGVADTEPDGMGGKVMLSLESRIKLLAEPRAGRDLEGE